MTSRINHNNPKNVGAFPLTYHYEMISDAKRVQPFRETIRSQCQGKVVFESGTGTGILSILAAQAGAQKVFCTEIDPNIAEFARRNIRQAGLEERITLLPKSTLEVTSDDLQALSVDVAIAENLSTWQVTEPQNQVANHLQATLLTSASVFIPLISRNYLQLCNSQFTFFDCVELRTHYFEFTGIPRARDLSAPTLASTFDYSGKVATALSLAIEVVPWSSGIANSVRLSSPVEIAPGVHFDSSDSLMPPVVVPLEQDIEVEAGVPFSVHLNYETNTCWEGFSCVVNR